MYIATDVTTEDELISDDTTVDKRELNVLSHLRENAATDSRTTDSGTPPSTSADDESRVSQRSIAEALGMSVGLTNAILKRLTDKGFLMMRRINHNNVHYLVTPAGIEQLGRRSYYYLRRTIGNVVRYKERIRAFCREQKHAGINEIVLVGASDLTFILEWCADKEGLAFRHVDGLDEVEPDRTHGGGIVPRTSSSGTTLNRAGAAGTDQAGSVKPGQDSGKSHPDRGVNAPA
ncbi:MAG: winged helix-turn-helix transcriptional regulator, partial [Spirochaeta sp.]|nr:winged helix-turn-helix transcriptional regulator [Spirochaeta sp.]